MTTLHAWTHNCELNFNMCSCLVQAQVQDMEEQLQYTRKENSDLQSQLEGLSHMINFIAQVNHTQSKDTWFMYDFV